MDNEQKLAVSYHETAKEFALKYEQFRHEFAISAMRMIIILNGGSIISVLTYMGNVDPLYNINYLKYGMASLISGTILSIITYLFAYFSSIHHSQQYREDSIDSLRHGYRSEGIFNNVKSAQTGTIYTNLAIITTIISILLFSLGSFLCLFALV